MPISFDITKLKVYYIPEAHKNEYTTKAAQAYSNRLLKVILFQSMAWIAPITLLAGTILATTYFGKAYSHDLNLAAAGGSAIALSGAGISLVAMGYFLTKAWHHERYLAEYYYDRNTNQWETYWDLVNAHAMREWQKEKPNLINFPQQPLIQNPPPRVSSRWAVAHLNWGEIEQTKRYEFTVFAEELYTQYETSSWMQSWAAWAILFASCGAIIVGVTLFGDHLSYDQPIAGAGGTAITMTSLTGAIWGTYYLQACSKREEYFSHMSSFNYLAHSKWREKQQKEQREQNGNIAPLPVVAAAPQGPAAAVVQAGGV